MKEPIKLSETGAVADNNYLAWLLTNENGYDFNIFKICLSDGTAIDLTSHFYARYSDHSILLTVDDGKWVTDTLTDTLLARLVDSTLTPGQIMDWVSGFYRGWLTTSLYKEDNPSLNETFKFLFGIYKIYMSYYERLEALWGLSQEMLYTEDLDNLLNDSYVIQTGSTTSSQKTASVTHPLDASDIDEGIVDISGTGDNTSDNTSSTTGRSRNYFAQFKNLWYNWKDIKQDIVNAMSYLFVEVLDI